MTQDGLLTVMTAALRDSSAAFLKATRNKEVPTAICCDEDFAPTLFAVRTVATDPDHARRVLRKLTICSPVRADLLRRGFLTCLPEKELYPLPAGQPSCCGRGPAFCKTFPTRHCHPVAKAVRHLNSEAHLLKGFVRFSELGGVLGGEIAPKNRVLPLLRSHFCARYRNESLLPLRPHPPRGAVLRRRPGSDPSAGGISRWRRRTRRRPSTGCCGSGFTTPSPSGSGKTPAAG